MADNFGKDRFDGMRAGGAMERLSGRSSFSAGVVVAMIMAFLLLAAGVVFFVSSGTTIVTSDVPEVEIR